MNKKPQLDSKTQLAIMREILLEDEQVKRCFTIKIDNEKAKFIEFNLSSKVYCTSQMQL